MFWYVYYKYKDGDEMIFEEQYLPADVYFDMVFNSDRWIIDSHKIACIEV